LKEPSSTTDDKSPSTPRTPVPNNSENSQIPLSPRSRNIISPTDPNTTPSPFQLPAAAHVRTPPHQILRTENLTTPPGAPKGGTDVLEGWKSTRTFDEREENVSPFGSPPTRAKRSKLNETTNSNSPSCNDHKKNSKKDLDKKGPDDAVN
jgi:hypothetical protein